MFTKILKKIISPLFGKRKFQHFFEFLNQLSLIGMNISADSSPMDSGEKAALGYIRSRYKSISELILFDVGANIGNYSILLNEIFGQKANIYSFEPAHKTFQKLQLNIGNKPKTKLFNFGFGNENKKISLFRNIDESGLASVYKRKLDHFNIHMDKSEEIQIKTIDSFCIDHKIAHIHLLKLDVEGYEKAVLDGASKMLKFGAIDFIQFEFGGCNIDSRTFFQDFYYMLNDDYKLYRIVKDGLYQIYNYKEMYETFTLTNYLAEKK